MNDTTNVRLSVYEIGYLMSPSVAEENLPSKTEELRKIIADVGASVIAEEAPHRQRLAYTVHKKTLSGSYDKYNEAYFGWIKFETGPDKIVAVKNTFENHPSVLRSLIVSTVRENTYLGKRALAVASAFGGREDIASARPNTEKREKKEAAPVTVEEMDKSIDEMVKEVKI